MIFEIASRFYVRETKFVYDFGGGGERKRV